MSMCFEELNYKTWKPWGKKCVGSDHRISGSVSWNALLLICHVSTVRKHYATSTRRMYVHFLNLWGWNHHGRGRTFHCYTQNCRIVAISVRFWRAILIESKAVKWLNSYNYNLLLLIQKRAEKKKRKVSLKTTHGDILELVTNQIVEEDSEIRNISSTVSLWYLSSLQILTNSNQLKSFFFFFFSNKTE